MHGRSLALATDSEPVLLDSPQGCGVLSEGEVHDANAKAALRALTQSWRQLTMFKAVWRSAPAPRPAPWISLNAPLVTQR